jgi:Arc/MetJ-type ribon-helix-helix transcriptional regulator
MKKVIQMNDIVVSIRMPKSMLTKLKEHTKKDHYMDLSEQIRSLTRKKWLKFTQPELLEIQNLRKDIFNEIKKNSEQETSKKIIEELNQIKKSIKKNE